jgi:hypothetical protein
VDVPPGQDELVLGQAAGIYRERAVVAGCDDTSAARGSTTCHLARRGKRPSCLTLART